jgi:hypothetical protein
LLFAAGIGLALHTGYDSRSGDLAGREVVVKRQVEVGSSDFVT